jgi:hypothetical protein
MSKKHKKKKVKRYTKKQFKNVFCTKCPICSGVPKKLDFCYPMYNDNPHFFISKILPKLDEVKDWNTRTNNNVETEEKLFKEIFCDSGICDESWTGVEGESECPLLSECIKEFKLQISNTKSHSKKRKGKSNKKVKYVCEVYPTFFSSSKNGFREKIKEILDEYATDQNNNI